MKVKHLKTKTTIELSPSELHDWTRYVNQIDNMLDNYAEINDVYMSDVSNLSTIKWGLTRLFDLDWDGNTYNYKTSK
jgi:hypothetical protein